MRRRKTFAGYPTSKRRKRPPWRWKKSKFSWICSNEDEWHRIIFVLMTLFYPQPPVQTKTSSKAKAKAFRNNSGRAPKAFGPRSEADGSETSTAQALRSVAAHPASHVCFVTFIASTLSSSPSYKFNHQSALQWSNKLFFFKSINPFLSGILSVPKTSLVPSQFVRACLQWIIFPPRCSQKPVIKKGKPMGRMQRLISIFEPARPEPPRRPRQNLKYPSVMK